MALLSLPCNAVMAVTSQQLRRPLDHSSARQLRTLVSVTLAHLVSVHETSVGVSVLAQDWVGMRVSLRCCVWPGGVPR